MPKSETPQISWKKHAPTYSWHQNLTLESTRGFSGRSLWGSLKSNSFLLLPRLSEAAEAAAASACFSRCWLVVTFNFMGLTSVKCSTNQGSSEHWDRNESWRTKDSLSWSCIAFNRLDASPRAWPPRLEPRLPRSLTFSSQVKYCKATLLTILKASL